MVCSMCNEIEICGKTNHSLRATGASRLFEANVSEKMIQERTSDRSINALRQYERTSTMHQQAVSSIVASSSGLTPQLRPPVSTQPMYHGLFPSLMKDCSLSR